MKYYISILTLLVVSTLCSDKLLAQNTSSHHIDFSCFTYQQLSKDNNSNLFFSPMSLQSILNAAYIGAKGETQKEIGNALQLPSQSFESNLDILTAGSENEKLKGITLDIANNIWVEKTINLSSSYQNTIKKFDTKISNVDFKNNADLARRHINENIEKQTNGKIKELLKSGTVDGLARMIFTNAIYFNGDWEEQFDEYYTDHRNFHISENNSKPAKFMSRKGYYNYASNDEMQIVELPYKGKEASLIILLPKEKLGLSKLEAQLSSKNLNDWLSKTEDKEVSIFVPKFKLENTFDLRSYLQQMGINLAFDQEADFSGITSEDVHLGKITHQTTVEISERGTEATAATSALFMAKGASVETPIFMADHPFMFLIRNNKSGQILFMGRFTNPVVLGTAFNGIPKSHDFIAEKSASKVFHVVSEGETLYQISKTYGVKADYIALTNKIEGNTIFKGQKILIEKTGESKVPVSYEVNPDHDNPNFHFVRTGETLYSIAKQHGLSVDKLKTMNGLSDNEIALGEKLKIHQPVRFLIHIVKSGDTLSYISRKYNKNLTELVKENQLTSNTIYIGQELKIEL